MAPKITNGGGKRKAPSDVKDKVKKIKLDTTAQADARKKFDPSRKFDASTRKRFDSSNKYETKKKFDSSRKSLVSKDDSDDDNDLSASDAEDGGAALKGRTMTSKFDKSKGDYNGKPANGSNGKTFDREPPTGQSSKEAHAKQKQLAQERRAAKPLADELHQLKKIWEKLRRKSHVPKEERKVLLEELYPIINGRIKDMVLKHDAVRAVQTAIKYSTRDQRKGIAKELQGAYAQLAESRYAKFLIGKLLVQDDDEIRDLIIPEFYGKVRKLINHPEASWILDDVYRGVATPEQKASLLREWYGPEFSLFKSPDSEDLTADLSKILEKEPAKKPHVMNDLFQMINSLIQKKMTGFTMLHDAMLQYFLNLSPESDDYKNFVETIKEDENGDLLKNMAFTESGARLVCLLLAHGNAKDRKQILRTFKDTYQLMAGDKHGHRVILTAYDVVDDTVLTSKSIFSEILGKNEETDVGNIVFLANDLNARTTIMYLFEGMSRALFPPSHKRDLELLKEVQAIREKTSKKDPEIRRKELVTALSPQLLAAVEASPEALVATSFGCQFVTDVLLSTVGDKEKALHAIAATAAGDPDAPVQEDAYPPQRPHISHEQHVGRMFKTLVGGGRFDKATGKVKPIDPPLKFADILYPHIKEHVVSWATGASSFVVLSLLEAEDFSDAKKLRKTLSKSEDALKKAATEETANQKAMREAFAAKPVDAKAKKSKKPFKEHEVGNMGSKLLLEKLKA